MPMLKSIKCLSLILLLLFALPAHAQLRGHGGPVRALAIAPDGTHAVSGSFDTSAIRWSLTLNTAEQVLRASRRRGECVAYLKDGRIVTAGADAHIAIWTPGQQQPDRILDGHTAPIASLAVSPDNTMLASASWDRTIRLWPLNGGEPRVLEGNAQNANGVAFSPDGKNVVSAGYDATVRIWPLAGGGEDRPQFANAAQRCRGCARRGDRCSRGERQGLLPVGKRRGSCRGRSIADARHRCRNLSRRQPRRGSWYSRLRGGDRAQELASSRIRWLAQACRSGRWRSFPITGHC